MAEQAVAYVTLVPTAKGFQSSIAKELAGVGGEGSKTGKNLGNKLAGGFSAALKGGAVVAGAVAGISAATVAAFAPAINAASNYFAEFEGVNQIFGEAAGKVQEFAASAATNLGISETAALNASKNFGIFATSAGLGADASAQFSTELVSAAADLGSFNDVPVEETLAAITSGLQGSSEPLRRFGIFLDDNAIKAYAMDKGIGDVYENMTSNEKTLLRQQALMEQLGVQQGDFVNYADTYGNAIKTIQATFSDLGVQIGNILMPMVEGMAIDFKDALVEMGDPTTDLGQKWEGLKASFQTLADAFATAFGDIEVADILGAIVDGLKHTINFFSRTAFVAGEVGKIIGKVFSGDFEGAGKALDSFGSRFNTFVDNQNKKQNDLVNAAIGKKLAANNKELYEAMTGTGKFAKTPTLSKAIDDVIKNVTVKGSTAAKAVAKTVVDYTKRIKSAIQDSRKDLIANRKDYNEAIAQANKDYADAQLEINTRYTEAVNEATKRRDQDQARALQDYQNNVAKINQDTGKKLADIVKQSQDRLRDAFQQVASVNIGSLFASEEVNKNVVGLVDSLRDKLTKSRLLIAKTAELAAAGYSQTFIEQVTAAGGDVGVELADSILNATPEQQKELKNLFNVIETESATGMDKLAATLYEKNGLATEQLKGMYASVLTEQQVALAEQKTAYDTALAEINAVFNADLADAAATRDKALTEAQTKLDEALLKAATTYLENLDTIKANFKASIEDFKKDAKKMRDEIDALNKAVSVAQTAGRSTVTKLQTKGLTPLATGGLVTGPTPALVGEAGPELVIPLDKFQSMQESGSGKTINYFAAKNESIDSEQALFTAIRRAKVLVPAW